MTLESDPFSQVVPPLPPRYRFRDLIWGDHAISDENRNGWLGDVSMPFDNGGDRVRVEYFTNERSFKERLQLYFVKNQRSSLRIRIFNLIIKVVSCILYVVRVGIDETHKYCKADNLTQYRCQDGLYSEETKELFRQNQTINWNLIGWVERDFGLWAIQVTVAVISLLETLLLTYLGYKGNILQQILCVEFLLEIINTVPFIVTIFDEKLRNLFVPVFFNCWLAKSALENVFYDLHRVMQKSQSALSQQLTMMCATLVCLCFTSVCGIQHLQRGGNVQIGFFDSIWFVIVTFSTVGYGDLTPDIWPSQLFMMCMIVAALIVLPSQFEQLAYTWVERQKLGGTYSSHRAQTEKHVVVCTTTLHADTVMDFLNEFYAHPLLQDFYVVLLSPCELDATMKMILQVPIWAQRVIYIQGSALKDSDLARCRMQDAEACFILAARNYADKSASDQHTVLRSWAVKDFSPLCPQYVQIFRPENKFHVKFAEHVVCEDEFRYALLANNCLVPGTSTLVTLLLHTSRGQEGQTSHEEWQKVYGRCSGNEIYHIVLGNSQFFGEYEGKSFTYASFHAHRKYGVSLVAVRKESPNAHIQLNPGPRHIMRASDTCFYMSITKEENSAFILAHPNNEKEQSRTERLRASIRRSAANNGDTKSKAVVASMIAGVGTLALELQHTRSQESIPTEQADGSSSASELPKQQVELPKGLTIASLNKRPSIAPVPALLQFLESENIAITVEDSHTMEDSETDDVTDGDMAWDESQEDYVSGFPPIFPYIGTSKTLCHLLKIKRPLCCLELSMTCEHCGFCSAIDYNWSNKVVILASDSASNGLYNFIVPLRSHCRPKASLNPIVLLLERRPELIFLETMSFFPMVYWMIGKIDCLDDLLRSGISFADNIVVVNKEVSNCEEEDYLADCNTIVAVQTIFRLFPSANIITELSQSTNMRFMQFRAKDRYALQLSKVEKKEKERGSHISYMFRLPFAAGNVFSASMLDTLLYQAFVKPYLITFVRLLLGIDQAVGSGHLACMKITKDDMWIRTYGRLYQKLCSTTCEVPIGIYRTFAQLHSSESQLSLNVHMDEEQLSASLTEERKEISQMVRCRMSTLGLSADDYDDVSGKRNTISYVIINPSYDLKLEEGDIVYLISPSSLSPVPSPMVDKRRALQEDIREDPAGANPDDQEGAAQPGFSTQVSQTDGVTCVQLEVPVLSSAVTGVSGTIV